MKKNNDILVISAVPGELINIVSRLSVEDTIIPNGNKVFSGKIGNSTVRAAATGPGIVNTAHALTCLIEKNRPSLIIQTGCAGGFKKSGVKIGELAVASEEIDISTGIEPADRPDMIPLSPLPFSILNKDTTNRFKTDSGLVKKFINSVHNSPALQPAVVYEGPFITCSTVTATDKRAEMIYEAYEPVMESMEGSASAHTSRLYNIPFIEIRAASNYTGKRDRASWDLESAFNMCSLAVVEFIKTFKH